MEIINFPDNWLNSGSAFIISIIVFVATVFIIACIWGVYSNKAESSNNQEENVYTDNLPGPSFVAFAFSTIVAITGFIVVASLVSGSNRVNKESVLETKEMVVDAQETLYEEKGFYTTSVLDLQVLNSDLKDKLETTNIDIEVGPATDTLKINLDSEGAFARAKDSVLLEGQTLTDADKSAEIVQKVKTSASL